MWHKMTIISLMAILVFFSTNVLSAQYENYEWGMSKQEVIKKIKENGYNIEMNHSLEKDGHEALGYRDTLFNEDIRVFLSFAPKSKVLCVSSITSDGDSVGRKLKPILTKKYGKPTRPNQFSDEYVWSEGGIPSVILEYTFKTMVIYYSSEYYPIFEKENEEINAEEAKGKF